MVRRLQEERALHAGPADEDFLKDLLGLERRMNPSRFGGLQKSRGFRRSLGSGVEFSIPPARDIAWRSLRGHWEGVGGGGSGERPRDRASARELWKSGGSALR